MKVFAYRNLNRKGVVWSIKDRSTSRVVDRVHEAYFRDVLLKVSKSGRDRVLREKRKNVHAGVHATRIEALPDNLLWHRVSYNPYLAGSFLFEDGSPAIRADYAKLNEQGLFISFKK
jgi:hypothetical protein